MLLSCLVECHTGAIVSHLYGERIKSLKRDVWLDILIILVSFVLMIRIIQIYLLNQYLDVLS